MYKKQLTVQKILCMAAVIVSAVVFFYALIGLILLAVLLLITNTHVRRKYYIGNYVATGLFAIASVAISIFGHTYIEIFKGQFLQVDFAALKEHAEMWGTLYTESTFWFDIHYLVFALLLIVAALLVANAVWKTRLMKEEQQLLRGEKGVQA